MMGEMSGAQSIHRTRCSTVGQNKSVQEVRARDSLRQSCITLGNTKPPVNNATKNFSIHFILTVNGIAPNFVPRTGYSAIVTPICEITVKLEGARSGKLSDMHAVTNARSGLSPHCLDITQCVVCATANTAPRKRKPGCWRRSRDF